MPKVKQPNSLKVRSILHEYVSELCKASTRFVS